MAKTTTVKATFFTTTIEVPVKVLILSNTLKNLDIFELEHHFARLAHTQQPNNYFRGSNIQSDYEKCRIAMKWAYSCNASLENYSNSIDADGKKVVKFSFGFTDINSMLNFLRDLDSVVR